MKFYVAWRTSIKALLKNRRRSALTMIGIVIGISSVITIMSLGRGFQKETVKNLTNDDSDEITLDIYFTPEDQNLIMSNMTFYQKEDLQNIAMIDGVKKVEVPEDKLEFTSEEMIIRGKKINETITFIKEEGQEVIMGRRLSKEDYQTHQKVTAIDKKMAQALFEDEKNALGRGLELKGELFTIIGVFELPETESIFSMGVNVEVPESSYLDYFPKKASGTLIRLTIDSDATPNKVTTKVINTLKNEGTMRESGTYGVMDLSALTDGIGNILNGLTYFISAIAGISLFIAGVGVMNMMYISVSERTKEIGIRRALGATEKSIKMQFLLEGITITLIGGVIGYLLGIVVAWFISLFLPFSISVDLFTIVLSIGISTVIGLVFSVMPASAAAKKDLIDILR